VFVAAAGIAAWLGFGYGGGRTFPFACNLPTGPSLDAAKDPGLTRLPEPLPDENQEEGSIEIAELTGQEETLDSLLSAHITDENMAGEIAGGLAAVIAAGLDKPFSTVTPLEPSRRYLITLESNGNFLKATLEIDPANVFHAARKNGKIRYWKEDVVLDFKPETLTFTVDGSITESLQKSGEGIELALKLTNVFRWDIDFQSEVMKGDVCKVYFERRYADDRPSGYGRILMAVYEGKKTGKKTAVLFNSKYYDEKGAELKKNFLRSPLNMNLRVTSPYGARFHPVLQVYRKHNGVDYGAPHGTPVWSIAPGQVTFAGWKNGYGKYVCIRHENGYESRYGHLSKIFVRTGDRVKQLHRIGLVGQTGIATGPHLDFQLLLGNKHLDPLKVKMVRSVQTVPRPLETRFSEVVGECSLELQKVKLSARRP
jgi:murein DD-endopeptidase MepM/ murein hydrolase activator NlpD